MAVKKPVYSWFLSNQLPDATTVVSLATLLCSAGVNQMHRMLGLEVRVVATKVVAIRAMVMVMVMVVGRPVDRPMP